MMRNRRHALAGAMVLLTAAAAACGSDPAVPEHTTVATTSTQSVSMQSLESGMANAVAVAEQRGARLTVAVLDRATGRRVLAGADEPVETASVVKLFIAEDALFQENLGDVALTKDDHELIEVMLRSSDDYAATLLWERFGGADIVRRVVDRHALPSTTPPADGWWNTTTTPSDLLTWYDHVLAGSGGLDEENTARMIGHLMEFTSTGTDGYSQLFGLPAGLPGTADLGIKQGWMCCLDGEWVHLSTGFFGDDHRYVMVVASRETVTYEESDPLHGTGFLPDTALHDVIDDSSARHARETVTLAVTETFHDGHRP